jgi:hypothetical protein
MDDKSLKNQAQEIMTAVDHDLQVVNGSKALALQQEVDSRANAIMNTLFGVIHEVDIQAATQRVRAAQAKYPEVTPQELAQKLIREKCQRTGAVGAVTSGASLIPGIGTAAALTLGVAADIGATFKLQAELVLEIAAVYDYSLTETEKQQLVLLITGLSAGTGALARKAGQMIAVELSEKFAEKAFLKALPVVGVIASAGTNALSTYIIGQRADAYFRLGPEAVGTWSESLRAVTGVDERKIGEWLAESSRATGAAFTQGVNMVGEAGKAAGEAVASSANRVVVTVGPALATGAQKANQTAQRGLSAYFRWYINTWKAIFRVIGKIIRFIWAVLTYIPRQVARLFKQKSSN